MVGEGDWRSKWKILEHLMADEGGWRRNGIYLTLTGRLFVKV